MFRMQQRLRLDDEHAGREVAVRGRGRGRWHDARLLGRRQLHSRPLSPALFLPAIFFRLRSPREGAASRAQQHAEGPENGVGGVSSLHQGIGPKALHPWILSSVDSASGESVTAWVDRLHRGIERRLLHGWILHWGIMCAFNVSLGKKITHLSGNAI